MIGCKSWGWLVVALALVGCDDSKAPKPEPPPPEIAVAMHVHFGRPGATVGMAMRLIHDGSSTKKAQDTTSLLGEASGLPPALVAMADLLQPADVLVIESGGVRDRLVSMVPVPEPEKHVPTTDGYQLKPGPPQTVVGPDGEARCVISGERLWCSATAGARLAGLARAAQPTVNKWARDHTDAVIEIEGEALRQTVWPALREDAGLLLAGLAARLAHGARDPLASRLTELSELSPDALLEVVDRAVVRVRLDGGQARLEARVDVDPKAAGEAVVALEALHESTPLASALGHLPPDMHAAMVRADVGLRQGVILDAIVRAAEGQTDAMEKVTALEGTMLPGVVAGAVWAGERRVLLEAQRSRDPEATKKALAALTLSVKDAVVRPTAGGLAVELGGQRAHGTLVEDVLVIASGANMDDGALAAVIPTARAQPTTMAGALAPHAVGVGLAPANLARPGRATGTLTLGFRVTEKTPRRLRGALTIQADRPAMLELVRLLGLGRAKRPDPSLAPRDEHGEADGSAPE